MPPRTSPRRTLPPRRADREPGVVGTPRFTETLKRPLTDSNRRPPPYHGGSAVLRRSLRIGLYMPLRLQIERFELVAQCGSHRPGCPGRPATCPQDPSPAGWCGCLPAAAPANRSRLFFTSGAEPPVSCERTLAQASFTRPLPGGCLLWTW